MNVVKGSLIALVAFCAGFVAAMCAEPYLPGRAQSYRYEFEAHTKENVQLQLLLKSDNQQQDRYAVPDTDVPAKSATSPRAEDGGAQRRS